MVSEAKLKSDATPVEIVVMSRPSIALNVPDRPFVVISISDPGADEAILAASADCRAVLRLAFDDAAPRQGQTPRGKTLMQDVDADAVLAFVKQHTTSTPTAESPIATPVHAIVCQCEMGRSRSAGVAAALARILNGNDAFFFADYTPNEWVYQTILNRYAHSMNHSEQAKLYKPKFDRAQEYGATRKWPFHISCGGAVYRQNQNGREYALLCRLPRHDEQNETWHLPKGTLHHDETLEQCARREIGEESGRNVSIGAYLGSLHGRWTMPSGKRMDKTTHFFLCRDIDATPEGMDAEHDRLEWFAPDAALEKLETEPKGEGEIIRRAEQWLTQFAPVVAPNAPQDV